MKYTFPNLIPKFLFVKPKIFLWYPFYELILILMEYIIFLSILPKANPHFMKFLFFIFLIRSIIINHSDINTPKKKILWRLSFGLSQYYKGKIIIIYNLFNSYLIVAPFAKIWQCLIINDKQGEEDFIHRNKIT